MIHDIHDKIIYRPRHLGIFDVNSLRVIEGITVKQFRKFSKIDNINKAFLYKTGRRPNDAEIDYQKRIDAGEYIPETIYRYNWSSYATQNILLKHPTLMPSTKEIKTIAENTFGHKLNQDFIYYIGLLVRMKVYDLNTAYWGVNVWQVMTVIYALESLKTKRDKKSISLLFNKIYKREPLPVEIKLCKEAQLGNYEETKNAFESIVEVRGQREVSFKRRIG